jgi:predicted N-formylglutamate amidohydrolase
VLLCEHASNHMPKEYGALGLDPVDVERHIAWDIGTAEVTRHLSALIDAPAFLGTYSRLLIDLNRPLGAPSSMPTRSENTDIPGNMGLGAGEVARRVEIMFAPFHRRVSEHLDLRSREQRLTRLVTIHSFTPVFDGVRRPWHAGVLFEQASDFGWEAIARLRDFHLLVDANVPYKTDRAQDYAIPIHGDDRGIPAILIEIRNDLISVSSGANEWGSRLAGAISTGR